MMSSENGVVIPLETWNVRSSALRPRADPLPREFCNVSQGEFQKFIF